LKISKEIGSKAEVKAQEYLKNLEYTIVDTNFYSRFGEIDIIARKEDVLHFIEVKYSKRYLPHFRITPIKMDKIIKTIHYYMYTKKIDSDYQIDAILIEDTKIELVENISY
jgi:putative endonuclease